LAQVGGEDLSRSFLSLVESGRSRISLRALAIVAEKLEVPIGSLLADEDVARAAELVLDGAEIALEQDDPAAALRTINQLQGPAKVATRARFLGGRALLAQRRNQEAIPELRAAVAGMEAQENRLELGDALYSLGAALYGSGQYEEALVQFRRGLEHVAASKTASPALRARLMAGVGDVLFGRGDVDGAIAQYNGARELFRTLYDLNNVGTVFSAMSLAARRYGDLEGAVHYSKHSLAAFKLRQDWRQVARELNNMAGRYRERGDLNAAAGLADEAVRRAQEANAEDLEAQARSTLAWIFLEDGRVAEAEREAASAEALASAELNLALVDAWVVRARVAAIEDRNADADSGFRKALDALAEMKHHARFADVALVYSRVLRNRGEIDGALDLAYRAAEAKAARTA